MADARISLESTDCSSHDGQGQKVIVAVDRSQQAEEALEWYLKAIHRPENILQLVHIPEGPTLRGADGLQLSVGDIQKLVEIEKKENDEMTYKYKTVLDKHGVKGDILVVYNSNPGEAIVETALKEHADMVVMGTRGMGLVRRTILGSVSDYVIHHSNVPVTVFRH